LLLDLEQRGNEELAMLRSNHLCCQRSAAARRRSTRGGSLELKDDVVILKWYVDDVALGPRIQRLCSHRSRDALPSPEAHHSSRRCVRRGYTSYTI